MICIIIIYSLDHIANQTKEKRCTDEIRMTEKEVKRMESPTEDGFWTELLSFGLELNYARGEHPFEANTPFLV